MGSAPDDRALVHDQDEVGVLDGADALGHDHGGGGVGFPVFGEGLAEGGVGLVAVVARDCGRLILISLGEDIVLAITKNNNSKNTKSVIEDIAKVASTLFRLFRAILIYDLTI